MEQILGIGQGAVGPDLGWCQNNRLDRRSVDRIALGVYPGILGHQHRPVEIVEPGQRVAHRVAFGVLLLDPHLAHPPIVVVLGDPTNVVFVVVRQRRISLRVKHEVLIVRLVAVVPNLCQLAGIGHALAEVSLFDEHHVIGETQFPVRAVVLLRIFKRGA